jgi:hypothetical protein
VWDDVPLHALGLDPVLAHLSAGRGLRVGDLLELGLPQRRRVGELAAQRAEVGLLVVADLDPAQRAQQADAADPEQGAAVDRRSSGSHFLTTTVMVISVSWKVQYSLYLPVFVNVWDHFAWVA